MENKIQQIFDTQDMKFMIELSFYVQQLFLYYARKKISKRNKRNKINKDTKQMLLSNKIVKFFQTMPLNYKPKLHNFGNTCWVSSSIWFTASMQLLLNMLCNYNEKDSLHPVLKFLSINMNVNTPVDEREYAFEDKKKFIEQCIVSNVHKSNAMKREQLDVSENFSDIIDIIPDIIKNQLFVNRIISAKSRLIITSDTYTDIPQLYAYFISELNKLSTAIVELNKFDTEIIDKYFKNKNPNIDVKLDLPGDISFFQDILSTNERITIDIYCNRGETTEIKELLCKFVEIYTQCKILQDKPADKSIQEYDFNLPILEHNSVQDYFDNINNVNNRLDEYTLFNVERSETSNVNVKDKTYLVIKLGYNRDDNYDIIFPTDFTITESIIIQNMEFILTAICMKSGSISGGHWWCLVKNTQGEGYIQYNDLRNDNPKIEDIDKVNRFNNRGYPSLLCYTWKGFY